MFFEHIEDRTLSKCPLLQFITIVKAFSDCTNFTSLMTYRVKILFYNQKNICIM